MKSKVLHVRKFQLFSAKISVCFLPHLLFMSLYFEVIIEKASYSFVTTVCFIDQAKTVLCICCMLCMYCVSLCIYTHSIYNVCACMCVNTAEAGVMIKMWHNGPFLAQPWGFPQWHKALNNGLLGMYTRMESNDCKGKADLSSVPIAKPQQL